MAFAVRDDGIHLEDYLRILRKRLWIILAVMLLVTVVGTLYVYVQTPIYQAAALVQIDPDAPRVIGIQEVVPIGSPTADYLPTQYALVRSRAVLGEAMELAKLKERIPGLASVDDPTALIRPAVTVEPRRGTRLAEIRFESPSAEFAAEMANAVANAYVKHNLDTKLRGTQEAIAWLTGQMSELQEKVQGSLTSLQNFRIKAGILGLGEQRQITTSKIMTFNNAYLEAKAQRLTIDAKLRELTAIMKDPIGAQTVYAVADTPLIQKLKGEASDLDVQLAKLRQTYRDKHPEVLKLQAQLSLVREKIDVALQAILRAVQTELSVARAREAAMFRQLNELKQEGTALNETEIQYQGMAKETESIQRMFDLVLQRLKETSITSGLETNNVRLVETARVPGAPARPNKQGSVVLSMAVGLVLGVMLAFFLDYLDQTIKTPQDLKRAFDIPILAVIPLFEPKAAARR